MKPKADWTLEDYGVEIRSRREAAASKREDAERLDREAAELAKETVKFNVMDLPIINPEAKPCKLARQPS